MQAYHYRRTQRQTMPQIPRIQEPSATASRSKADPPLTPRSRFLSFFQLRKVDDGSLKPSTRFGDGDTRQCPASRDSNVQPAVSPRMGLETGISDNLGRRQTRRREKIITDPPPLAQVHRQAILHAMLETPVSFTEKTRSRAASSSNANLAPHETLESTIEVKRPHRRTDSGESTCSTKDKAFFLINGPYLLQYDGDSEGDALPEKILVLQKHSVAFTCDAVPGRPWVLQVTKVIPCSEVPTPTLRPSWSRLTLRRPEGRRATNTMLLIFSDSEELYTWLFAIRKEIEQLGGTECHLDSPRDDQTWRDNLSRKFASTTNGEPDSYKPLTACKSLLTTSPHKPQQSAQHNAPVNERPQSVRSSVSSTSLDRLRDSVTSVGYSSTLATSNGGGSAPSTSPTCEHFPGIKSVTDQADSDLCLRTYPLSSGPVQYGVKPHLAGRSLLERRKLSLSTIQLVEQHGARARRLPSQQLPTILRSPMDILPRNIDPRKKSVQNEKVAEDTRASATIPPTTMPSIQKELCRPSGEHKHLSGRLSEAEIFDNAPKSKYSLFPAQSTTDIKIEPLVDPITLTSLPPPTKARRSQMHDADESARQETRHSKKRSRTVTLELRQHRASALLGAGEIDRPQRSPAVTDDMIMSNFGITCSKPPASPMPAFKVPGLADLEIDLDFLRTPYKDDSKWQTPLTAARRSSTAKSISSMHSDSSTTMSKAPVGPPPAGPLPAIPSGSRPKSYTNRSSQHCQSRRSSHGRKTVQVDPNDYKHFVMTLTDTTAIVKPSSYNEDTPARLQRHRRTISSSLDGLPAPEQASNKPQGQTEKSRPCSQSRGRRKSSKQQNHVVTFTPSNCYDTYI